jgi:hypothetical protein
VVLVMVAGEGELPTLKDNGRKEERQNENIEMD